jgi:hypothetical protein
MYIYMTLDTKYRLLNHNVTPVHVYLSFTCPVVNTFLMLVDIPDCCWDYLLVDIPECCWDYLLVDIPECCWDYMLFQLGRLNASPMRTKMS